jgi:hypothetical protein
MSLKHDHDPMTLDRVGLLYISGPAIDMKFQKRPTSYKYVVGTRIPCSALDETCFEVRGDDKSMLN